MNVSRARRFPALDGLRGFAALHIVLGHLASLYDVSFHPAIAASLSPFHRGLTCYPLFFVLSGFGLARARDGWDARPDGTGSGSFWASRMRRLAVPYYAALALCLLVPTAAPVARPPEFVASMSDTRSLVTHALFVHGFWGDTIYAINPPLWSMSLTFQFYLIFPLLYLALRKVDYRCWIVVAASLWLALRAAIVYVPVVESSQFDGFILSRLLPFVTGMAIARWEQGRVPEDEADNRGRRAIAPLSAVLLIGAVAVQAWRGRGGWMIDLLYSAGYSSLIVAVILSATRDGLASRAFGSRTLVRLGSLSYAIYLTHDPVLLRLTGTYRLAISEPGFLSDLSLVALGLALVVAFGWLFHRLLERRVTWARAAA